MTLDPLARELVMDVLYGRWLMHCVGALAELAVPDGLHTGAKAPDELAPEVGADPGALTRLMRAGALAGLFEEHADGRFSLTPLGDTLRQDATGSLRLIARFMNHPVQLKAWTHLTDAVRTGESAFSRAFGQPMFDWLGEHRDVGDGFDDVMTHYTRSLAPVVADAGGFQAGETIVDVGGGNGLLVAAIVAHVPGTRGVVFDLEPVVAGAAAVLDEFGVADRVAVRAGSFLEGVPAGGDVYLLKNILHDWDDARCLTLLRHIQSALGPDGRVIAVEIPLGSAGNRGKIATLLDMEMLVMTEGGRERTRDEYATLLGAAGLRLARVIPTGGPYRLLEARRA